MFRNIKVLVILPVLITCIPACNKEKPFDIRDNFVGQYQVMQELQSYGFPVCGKNYYQVKDTLIIVDYGITDSTISVLGRDVCLDSNGYYSAYHYYLRIWNDSISSFFMNGGLGCGTYETYSGFRISEKP